MRAGRPTGRGVRAAARRAAIAAAALGLTGCASLTPVEGPPIQGLLPAKPAPRDTAQAARRDTSAQVRARAAAGVVDSLPGLDAQRVLDAIPEPLAPGERVPPPDSGASAGGAEIPTPAPTRAMGEAPGAPAVEEAPPAAASAPDTCWRVQVGAPATAEEAEQRRKAAESQLVVPFVVETDRGLFKVRTRDCVGRAAALALRDRAIDSGFAGAFPIATFRQ